MTEPRIRINSKQTAKDLWYFDITLEDGAFNMRIPGNPDDICDEKSITMGERIILILKDVEKNFRHDNRRLVSDGHESG